LQEYIEKLADTWDGDVAYEVAKMRDNYLEIVITSSPNKPAVCNSGKEIDWFDRTHLSVAELQLILLGAENSKLLKVETELFSRGSSIEKIYIVEAGELTIESMNCSERIFMAKIKSCDCVDFHQKS